MIVVTGGAGFIGSNLVQALNQRGREDIIVVDDLSDGRKVLNLADCEIYDLVDKDVFAGWLAEGRDLGEKIDVLFHQGADSNTMEWDGAALLRTNYDYSKSLLSYCAAQKVRLVYASSASVYGRGPVFKEQRQFEKPLNPYAYSKFLFDQLVRRLSPGIRTQVAGLRYFNVYGPRESHKGGMASVAFKLREQLLESGAVRLFEGSDGYGDGDQRRDFVWVGDCTAVNLWLLDHPEVSGIFNVGTGRAQPFNDVARAVIDHFGRGVVEYVPMPSALEGRYQSYTQADIGALRAAGYDAPFLSVEQGVQQYMKWLEARD
ncbi:MAG: ADP-glyceromanno-heptose 6-epimerase [Deltaproteobacteria bacterium]|nr:ADP-glyceromanno-heptose 6-epimerase [Deltaproteobacteria bacterium]MBW2414652.1 ADP-glyceromanno-heptose 6-epimerase [Deltaproteobacteria bacterium]